MNALNISIVQLKGTSSNCLEMLNAVVLCLTRKQLAGGLGGVLSRLPELTLPQLPEPLQPSRRMRSSTFEVIYLDADLRVTRGDRGELRASGCVAVDLPTAR